MQHPEIIIFFLIISFVYASVGFGGGSSYLAVLAMYALPFKEMRLIALICNIIVVTGGTIIYVRNGQVNWKKILPIALASVPMAFIGARLKLSQSAFFVLLGCSLVVASVLLWIRTRNTDKTYDPKSNNIFMGIILGVVIGLLSGMVGIGGGIFLAPLLNLMYWDTPKKIAATASVFILVNSLSGIVGQMTAWNAEINFITVTVLCAAVFLGGQIGSRLGAGRFNQLVVRRMTAILVFFAGVEVLFKHLPGIKF